MQMNKESVSGSVTSLCKLDNGNAVIGCDSGEVFELETLRFHIRHKFSSHLGVINDMSFPK